MTLTNADIISRMSQLADIRGKADGGTTTTLINNKYSLDNIDDEFNNYYICFLNGDNKGVDRIVTDFDAQNGIFTFDELESSVNNSTLYALCEVGYLQYSDEAYIYIVERFKNDGKNISLFLNEAQLKELHLLKTLDLICQDKFNDATNEDMYYQRHLHYKETFENTYLSLVADYDLNENGAIDTDEEENKIGQIGFSR